MEENRYDCALITGASSGLGEEFAWQLAGRVKKMVLVARSSGKLESLAAQLREAVPAMAVLVITADVSKESERISLMENLIERRWLPDLLINNAGLGDYGEFLTADWAVLESMLKVNITALTHLSHLAVPGMVKAGGGAILNVSSLASVIPIPDFAVYAATKAYVSSFSEALRIELRESNIRVMSLCPGPVKTGFGEAARREGSKTGLPAHKSFYVPKEQVVAEGLKGLFSGRARVFPGLKIAAAGMLLGALPIVIVREMMKHRPRR